MPPFKTPIQKGNLFLGRGIPYVEAERKLVCKNTRREEENPAIPTICTLFLQIRSLEFQGRPKAAKTSRPAPPPPRGSEEPVRSAFLCWPARWALRLPFPPSPGTTLSGHRAASTTPPQEARPPYLLLAIRVVFPGWPAGTGESSLPEVQRQERKQPRRLLERPLPVPGSSSCFSIFNSLNKLCNNPGTPSGRKGSLPLE